MPCILPSGFKPTRASCSSSLRPSSEFPSPPFRLQNIPLFPTAHCIPLPPIHSGFKVRATTSTISAMATQPRYAAFSHVLLFYGCLIMPYTWFLLSSPSFSCIKSPNGFCLMPLFHFVTLFISILFSVFDILLPYSTHLFNSIYSF